MNRVVLLRGGRYRHLCRLLLDLPRLIASDAILLLLILNLKLLYLREKAEFVYLCLKRLIGDRNMELLIGPIERAHILLRIVQFVLLIDRLESQDHLVCVLYGLDNCIAHDLEQFSRGRVRSIGLVIRSHSDNLMVHTAMPGQRGAVEIFRLVLHASLLRVNPGQDHGVALCVLLQVNCHRTDAAAQRY